MTMPEASKGNGSPPPPPAYTYRQPVGENKQPHPTLPPMSHLLRHEEAPEQHQPHLASYVARQFLPPYNMIKQQHPLFLAESNPDAPVQHIYHPPQPHSNSHQPNPKPILIPAAHTLAYPPLPPPGSTPVIAPPRTRQYKRIVQRQPDPDKQQEEQLSETSSRQGRKKSRSPPRQKEIEIDMDVPLWREPRMNDTLSYLPPTSESFSSQTPRLPTASPFSTQSQGSSPMQSFSTPSPFSPQLHSAPQQALLSRPRSIPIAGLLSTPSPPTRQPVYTIRMRQQPKSARACGFGERDRRVIDPPPILQMDVHAPGATPDEMGTLLRAPCTMVLCVLWDPDTNSDASAMPGSTDKRMQRRLMGSLVASPFIGLDEHGIEGCFFPFPDLSVRTPGTFALKFKLVQLDKDRMCPGASATVESTVISAPFHVFNAKDFGGMRASSELTKTLKHQGCLISVKKGNGGNAKNGKNARLVDESEEEEDDDDDDEDEGGRHGAKRIRR